MSPPLVRLGPAAATPGAWSARVAATSPLTIRFDGQAATIAAKTAASYTPVVGDLVATIPLDGTRRLILCKIT